MRIRSFLALTAYASLAIICFMVLATGGMMLATRRTNDHLSIIENLKTYVLERALLRTEYYIHHGNTERIQALARSDSLISLLETAQASFTGLTDKQMLEDIIQENARIVELFDIYINLVQRKDSYSNTEVQTSEYEKNLFSQIQIQGYLLNSNIQNLELSQRKKLAVLNSVSTWLQTSFLVLNTVIILVNAMWVTRKLAHGVERLKEGTTRIGGGDLEFRLAETPDDEIADVAKGINMMATSLSSSFSSIRTLENEASRRNTLLESANKELETFAYSVAHDLRAPLRSIDGFACILQEDYGKALGQEGNRLLDIIRSSGQKMDTLTQDLLELTRVGKTDIEKSIVDMRKLAIDTFGLCAAPSILADFDFRIGNIPKAQADASMMQRVWLNLLSNAVKYSVPGQVHRVEVDGTIKDGMAIYSVRDHGVGFDQQYAGKLFGVFQRLHGSEEFPGSGIGLSIVKRIVERHGGKVWAEGRVGNGATFHFSLPTGGSI